jgi:hypothetical protein
VREGEEEEGHEEEEGQEVNPRQGEEVSMLSTVRRARSPLAVLAALLATTALAALGLPDSAPALGTDVFSLGFGGPGSEAGELSSPAGVAVDSATHEVYVADAGNHRVDEFTGAGAFTGAFGANVGGAGVDSCTSTCVAGTSGSGPGELETPTFIAVDNSAGPSAGDVYVGDTGDGVVTKFTSSGALLGKWGSGGQLDGSTTGAFGSLMGIAVGTTGTLYVLNAFVKMFEFEQSGAFSTEFEAERGTNPDGLAVDPAGDFFKVNGPGTVEEGTGSDKDVGQVTSETQAVGLASGASGDLYVAELASVKHYVFSGLGVVRYPGGGTCDFAPFKGCPATDAFGSDTPGGGSLSGGSGIGVDISNGDVYVADAAAARIDLYIPAVIPEVATGAASEVRPESATLNGTVDPEGVEVTSCHFEYVDEAGYDASAPDPYAEGSVVPCEEAVGSGAGAVAVKARITGLRASAMRYHFRLEAANATPETTVFGGDALFSSPSVEGESISGLTQTTVIVNARIEPLGEPTGYRVEYGTSTAYGSVAPEGEAGAVGSGLGAVNVAQELTGLEPGTAYHYRVVPIVATAPPGGVAGPDQTFTTLPLRPPVVSTGQASGVAQNSATLTGTVDTQGYETVYEFDIGVDTSYGTRIFGAAGLEAGAQTFTAALQGLMPGTTYHYRIVATNAFGTIYGADETFTTSTYPTATLAEPESPSLLPTALLASAGSSHSAHATASAAAGPSAHSAPHRRARASRRGRARREKTAGGTSRQGRAHGGNRGGDR